MTPPSAQTGLPRRIVALYLLFCLGSVMLLGAGSVFAARSLLSAQATGNALARFGRLAAAIELALLDEDPQAVQRQIATAFSTGHWSYGAVVGPDGRYLAHSNEAEIGEYATQAMGDALRWGDIEGVRYTDAHERVVHEYTAPLRVGDKPSGRLVVAMVEPGWSGVVARLASHSLWAVLAPLALVAMGVWWLRKTAQPLAEIDARLRRVAKLPYRQAPELQPVAPRSLAAIGWNRLSEHARQLQEAGAEKPSLEQRAEPAGSARTSQALQSLGEGVAVTDPEGRIDFANRAIAALLGSEEELEGQAFDELLQRLAPRQAEQMLAGAPNAEVVCEAPVDTDDGGRTLRLARSPLGGDAAAGHVWTVRDVTQQKLAEASRDQFIDTATHELRTPLANIKAYAETLSMCDVTDVEQQKEFCNTINTEATRLARFVDDLLSISSIEVGTLGVNRQNVDVRRLLEEAVDKVAPLMTQRSIAFERKIGEKLGEASLDKDKVSGLLVNLLGNAAKYTPVGGAVTFTASRQDGELTFEVRDTGVGIAADEQAKVFDKFFRSENPEVRDEVGTGLGLSLAREIARLHRGDIHLESELGEGSTFTVVLPVQ